MTVWVRRHLPLARLLIGQCPALGHHGDRLSAVHSAGLLGQKKIAFRAEHKGRSAIFVYAATQVASLIVVSTIANRFVTRVFVTDTLIFSITASAAVVVSYMMSIACTTVPSCRSPIIFAICPSPVPTSNISDPAGSSAQTG